MSADTAPLVSVVVPTHEHPEQLGRLLAGLDVQTLSPDRFEVVLADDGSDLAPEPGPRAYRVVVVRQDDQGFRAAAARNLGAAAASGDVLAFLDQDMVPAPDYLALVHEATRRPWALTVGRRCHVELTGWADDQVRSWLRGRGPGPAALADPSWLAEGYARTRDLTEPDDRAYQLVISAVLSLHRELFERLGGFESSIRGYGGEDWELAHRAYTAGADLRHVPGAVGWHDGPDLAGRGHGPSEIETVKNAETLTLARLLPDPDVRGSGLFWTYPATVVEIAAGECGAAALVACAENLLRAGDVGLWFTSTPAAVEATRALDDPRVHLGPVPGAVMDRARFRITAAPMRLLGGTLKRLCAEAPLDAHGVTVRRVRDQNRRTRGCPAAEARPWPQGIEVVPLVEEPFLERIWSRPRGEEATACP